ncbi:hypothetical protein E0M29_25070, partial [Bacillus cereus]
VGLRQTEIHLPPTVGLRPSHARGRRILSGNSLKSRETISNWLIEAYNSRLKSREYEDVLEKNNGSKKVFRGK